jgi:hypothetical protein
VDEEVIETVTVQATRLPDWTIIAMLVSLAYLAFKK